MQPMLPPCQHPIQVPDPTFELGRDPDVEECLSLLSDDKQLNDRMPQDFLPGTSSSYADGDQYRHQILPQ